MIITKHGVMRFKQRQKIKNSKEMIRKARHAIEHGKLLNNIPNSQETNCYLFNGFYYIISRDNERLVTVFRPKKTWKKGKRLLLEDIRIQEFREQFRNSSVVM